MFGALTVLGNAWLLRLYLARRDPGWLEGGEFEGMRWPLGLAGAFVLCGVAVVSPPLRPIAYNALVVLAFCFALQGLAVVAYYVRRLAAPPLMIAIVMAVLLLNPTRSTSWRCWGCSTSSSISASGPSLPSRKARRGRV